MARCPSSSPSCWPPAWRCRTPSPCPPPARAAAWCAVAPTGDSASASQSASRSVTRGGSCHDMSCHVTIVTSCHVTSCHVAGTSSSAARSTSSSAPPSTSRSAPPPPSRSAWRHLSRKLPDSQSNNSNSKYFFKNFMHTFKIAFPGMFDCKQATMQHRQ